MSAASPNKKRAQSLKRGRSMASARLLLLLAACLATLYGGEAISLRPWSRMEAPAGLSALGSRSRGQSVGNLGQEGGGPGVGIGGGSPGMLAFAGGLLGPAKAGSARRASLVSPRAAPARLVLGKKLVEATGRGRSSSPFLSGLKAAMMPSTAAEGRVTMEAVYTALEQGAISDGDTLNKLIGQVTLPKHPRAKFGQLPNGLAYCILPNAAPAGRFECHLEVCAGSADELISQQGMAHMCEHVSYMGSKKRERLFGTSSQTNAQTDFHHTVYWASCPKYRPSSGTPMLPLALDALCDVMEAKFEPSRVEKERSAILSEAAMVNTIDYRVEVQLLSALHSENRLNKRFPIGLVDQIKSWSNEEVKAYHRAHYRPDNAHLYVIGDVDTDEAEEMVARVFGHLENRPPQVYPPEEEMVYPNLKQENRFLPPVVHEWLGLKQHGRDAARVDIFQHELMQSFSVHLFAKLPVEPILTLADYRDAIIKRIIVVALQIRLNVHARGKPIVMVEFSHLDSPREGCAVCALDLVVDSDDWRNGVAIAVKEFKRMAEFGMSENELQRCLSALLSDSEQLAAQGDRMTNQDQLTYLMESVACEHTFMDAMQTHAATQIVTAALSVEDVNKVARDVCRHIAYFGQEGQDMPSSIVACAPTGVEVSRGAIMEALESAASQVVDASDDVLVPRSLVSKSKLRGMVEKANPVLMDAELGEGVGVDAGGVTMKVLDNGVKVNYKVCESESQRAHLRVTVPCGRASEKLFKQGAMAVGARTMQDGGAMLGWTRQQVELFCVDHLVVAEIACNEEFLFLEFISPTNKVTDTDAEDVSGIEGVFQILHGLINDFVWEEDALQRAQQAFIQTHEQVGKSLEAATAEHLLGQMCGEDPRYLSIPADAIEGLTLEDVKSAITSRLTTDNIELSISGDINPVEVERLVKSYIGTVERRPLIKPNDAESIPTPKPGAQRRMVIQIPDSDERAVAYVAGTAPNRWGIMADGTQALDASLPPSKTSVAKRLLSELPGLKRIGTTDAEDRNHPLFPCVALLLLQECLNRRLFSTVRERKRLTYDANFHLTSFETIQGGWYLVTVTAKPELAEQALLACVETLDAARGWDKITRDNLRSAQYELISKHQGAMQTNKHWVDMMCGLQLDEVPGKDLRSISDFTRIVQAVQVEDVQHMLECLDTNTDTIWTCIGVSGVKNGSGEGSEVGGDLHGSEGPSVATTFGRGSTLY